MKKLLLLFSLPLLFVANQSFAQTQQGVVAEILAKTEYKNVLGFLNALADTSINDVLFQKFSISDKESVMASIQPYLDKGAIKYASTSNKPHIYDNINYHDIKDTSNICVDKIRITGYWDSGETDWRAYYFWVNHSLNVTWMQCGGQVNFIPHTIYEDSLTEVSLFGLAFMKSDTSIMFYGKKVYLKYDNAHINLKNELLDNDLQGRMLTTNLSNSDSAFYSIDGGSKWQELPKYILFDEAKNITVKNYYKGCSDSVSFVKDSATEMPRIHDTLIVKDIITVTDTLTVKDTVYITKTDTIHITKTDTIYITKTDTIYIEKEPNKTAIINKQTNLNVWPNPTTTFVNAEAEEPFSYTLLNNAGVILKKEEGEPSYTISMEEYPDGIYFIKTSDGVIRKIVKK